MSGHEWANESLRKALQSIKDVETKPLHVEIERLQADNAALRARLAASEARVSGLEKDVVRLSIDLRECQTLLARARTV